MHTFIQKCTVLHRFAPIFQKTLVWHSPIHITGKGQATSPYPSLPLSACRPSYFFRSSAAADLKDKGPPELFTSFCTQYADHKTSELVPCTYFLWVNFLYHCGSLPQPQIDWCRRYTWVSHTSGNFNHFLQSQKCGRMVLVIVNPGNWESMVLECPWIQFCIKSFKSLKNR